MAAYSPDGVTGWSPPEFLEDLLEPGCMAGHGQSSRHRRNKKPLLLFSYPNTTERDHETG